MEYDSAGVICSCKGDLPDLEHHVLKSGASGYLVGTGFMSSPPQWK